MLESLVPNVETFTTGLNSYFLKENTCNQTILMFSACALVNIKKQSIFKPFHPLSNLKNTQVSYEEYDTGNK